MRSFTPDDYTNPDAPALGPDDWARMGRGRALLMVHGTFSRTHLAFAAMPKDYVESLHRQYEGRVFAFDHLFLSDDPADNVRWLLSQVPEGVSLDVDIICHSRGGLVSRTLAEKQAELSPTRQPFRVGTVVLVGVPNAGTALADPEHVTDIFDVFTNLINFVPDTFVVATGAMTMIVEAAKIAATGGLTHLAGLRSMRPGGDFTTWLNAAGPSGATRYVAVSSDVTPTEPGLVHLATSRLLTAILKSHSDFVVPTGGVYEANGSPHFPVAQPLLLTGADGVLHTKYFTLPRVREQVLAWLATT